MGRISLPVDLMEILALAWDHPLIAGVLMLMFTPPFFPVLVFFSPLLISTTLCAVALISVGQQIEDASKREREVAGWNARAADGEAVAVRERTSRRRRVPGEDNNWLDWVRGFEPGSVWQAESSFMEDVKEERLLSDFRLDEGGIDMKEEDFKQQIEALREFERNLGERSFSFRTGAAAAAAASIEALEAPVADSSMRMVPFRNASTEVQAPSPQIPSMFLYTLKTGGTGSAPGNANPLQPVSGGQRTPRRSPQQLQQLLQGGLEQQPRERRELPEPQEQPEQQQKSLVSFGSGFFAGGFDEPENDKQLLPLPEPERHPEPQQPQQQQFGLLSFGSGFPRGSYEDPKKDQNQRQDEQQGRLISFGSGFIGGSVDEAKNDNQHEQKPQQQEQQLQLQPRSTSLEMMHVSSTESAPSFKPVRNTGLALEKPTKSPFVEHRENRDGDRKTSIFCAFGGDSHSRPSQERSRALTYNASLIPGNAVIYTTDPSPIDTKLQRRNSLSSRERRGSSTASRQKRKHGAGERTSRHAPVENATGGDRMGMTTNAAR
ncbi:hypothetical protein MPTK1_1g14250 [Marchantia polymorpha subsp. ruderalis]|nr:hypothetical protein MARPO_0179s0006 [Marchantia polymorpha]BBM98534.1 hypothetical protein Mp_1g14250 [Marchantia polymorpha subsp. ruderalis]|eukprot:PTQ27915.1 hypothetical protein MARPO_0179s0006 [Marchantia polymorpha]